MDPQYSLAPVSYTSRMPTSLTRSGTTVGNGLRTMFQITIPLNDIPPPFKDTAVNKSFDLLQSTAVCRDGGRVPTPERMQVLEMAAGLEKHRLRRQQQLLLDIAQRCKEQNIASLSSSLSRKCPLSSFEGKYHRDMREYSTNTMLFKTWGNAFDSFPEPTDTKHYQHTEQNLGLERGNTFFPVRRIKRLPPKELYSKAPPKPQVGYSKGLLIKEPYDVDKKKALINDRKINGPIQLGLYNTPKNDLLQPLILPSIKYVGVDIDKIDSYVKSSKIKLAGGDNDKLHDVRAADAQPLQPVAPAGRIIIHSRRPAASESNHQVTLIQVPKSDTSDPKKTSAPPPSERSKAAADDPPTAVAMTSQPEEPDTAQNDDAKTT